MHRGLSIWLVVLLATTAHAGSSIVGLSKIQTTAAAGSTQYHPLGNTGTSTNSVEVEESFTFRGAGATLRDMNLYAGTNARGSASTVTLMKNGSNTDSVISVSGADQYFTDSVPNDVTLSAGDTFSASLLLGASSGNELQVRGLTFELATTSGPTVYLHQVAGDMAVSSATDGYIVPAGQMGSGVTATEASVAFRVRAPGWLKGINANTQGNTSGGNLVLTVRKNLADTIVTCTITAGTKNCVDTTNATRLASGDLVSIRVDGGAGLASVDLENVGYMVEADNTASDLLATGSETYSGASTTEYVMVFGSGLYDADTTDAKHKIKLPFAARVGRLRLYATAASAGTATATFREAGSDTTLVATVTAGGAGWYESAQSLYDDVADGAEIDVKLVTSSFTGTIVMMGLTLNYDPTGGGGSTVQVIQ